MQSQPFPLAPALSSTRGALLLHCHHGLLNILQLPCELLQDVLRKLTLERHLAHIQPAFISIIIIVVTVTIITGTVVTAIVIP